MFAGLQGSCLNTRLLGHEFQHLLRDVINAMKQAYHSVICILAFYHRTTQIASKTLEPPLPPPLIKIDVFGTFDLSKKNSIKLHIADSEHNVFKKQKQTFHIT